MEKTSLALSVVTPSDPNRIHASATGAPCVYCMYVIHKAITSIAWSAETASLILHQNNALSMT